MFPLGELVQAPPPACRRRPGLRRDPVETVKIGATPDDLPDIRDPDDIIFLVLAAAARAEALVSGDGDIQAVKAQFHVPILTVAEFSTWLQAH